MPIQLRERLHWCIVHTQAERLTGKKTSSKALYTQVLGTSAIVSLEALPLKYKFINP